MFVLLPSFWTAEPFWSQLLLLLHRNQTKNGWKVPSTALVSVAWVKKVKERQLLSSGSRSLVELGAKETWNLQTKRLSRAAIFFLAWFLCSLFLSTRFQNGCRGKGGGAGGYTPSGRSLGGGGWGVGWRGTIGRQRRLSRIQSILNPPLSHYRLWVSGSSTRPLPFVWARTYIYPFIPWHLFTLTETRLLFGHHLYLSTCETGGGGGTRELWRTFHLNGTKSPWTTM